MSADPLAMETVDPNRDPFDSNQAIPTLLFKRSDIRRRFEKRFPNLTVVDNRWLSLFAYPMTGGFKSWSLINGGMAEVMIRVEDAVLPILGPVLGFRLLTVLEKD